MRGLFTGISYPHSLKMWLREQFVDAGANRMSRWVDMSMNGNDADQATAAKQPLWVASDAAINNRPTVNFDGSRWMRTGPNFISAVGQLTTMFAVWRVTNTGVNQYISDGISINNRALFVQTGLHKIYQGVVLPGSAAANNTYYITYAVFSENASAIVATNGVETVGDAGNFGATGFTIGGSGGAAPAALITGDCAEVRAYRGAMNALDRGRVKLELSAYYNIAVV